MRALRVAQHLYLHSVSVHIFLRKLRVTETVQFLSYCEIMASGSQWWQEHSILDISLWSAKLGGQLIGPHLPIHFSGNLQFKKCVTSSWKCGSAPFVGTAYHEDTSRIGMWNSSKLSRYITPVTIGMAQKRTKHFSLNKA